VKRLTDRHTGDHVFLMSVALRLGPVVMIFLGAVEYYVWGPRFVWFILPNIAATALLVWLTALFVEGMANAAGRVLLPSGKGSPVAREYSEQEALVIRGRYVEAADSYRAIIEDDPGNLEARLRLGALLEQKCDDPEAAESCFREVRLRASTPQQEWLASNALIDLYHREGWREQLKQELARVSRRFPTTGAGASAQRRLDELIAEDAVSASRMESLP
jgi:tetratricopeptide (TPR) repeat protein